MPIIADNEPSIYIIKWRGTKRPQLNRMHSAQRLNYLKLIKAGHIVFILCENDNIYSWGQWRVPVFLTWDEFIKFYRGYDIKIL